MDAFIPMNATSAGKAIQEAVWQMIQDEGFESAFAPALNRPWIKLLYIIQWLVVHFPFTLVLFSILQVCKSVVTVCLLFRKMFFLQDDRMPKF